MPVRGERVARDRRDAPRNARPPPHNVSPGHHHVAYLEQVEDAAEAAVDSRVRLGALLVALLLLLSRRTL